MSARWDLIDYDDLAPVRLWPQSAIDHKPEHGRLARFRLAEHEAASAVTPFRSTPQGLRRLKSLNG